MELREFLMNKRLLIALAFGACLIAQGPTVTSEPMTPTEAQETAAITARVAAAQQSLNVAQAALRDAKIAQFDSAKKIQAAHGHTGYEAWKPQPNGSLVRAFHVVEIRGTLLIHTQDKADTCPAENVKTSGATYLCLSGK